MGEEFGKLTVQYKLRDWVFSAAVLGRADSVNSLRRLRNCGGSRKDLPVKLPNVKKYEPTGTGESPLAEIKKWLKTKCPKCKKIAARNQYNAAMGRQFLVLA